MDIFIPIFILFTVFVLCSLCGFCCKNRNEGAIFSSKYCDYSADDSFYKSRNSLSSRGDNMLDSKCPLIKSIFSSSSDYVTDTSTCWVCYRLPSRASSDYQHSHELSSYAHRSTIDANALQRQCDYLPDWAGLPRNCALPCQRSVSSRWTAVAVSSCWTALSTSFQSLSSATSSIQSTGID